MHLRTMKTNGSKAVIIVLVSLATLMMTSAESAQGFGLESYHKTKQERVAKARIGWIYVPRFLLH